MNIESKETMLDASTVIPVGMYIHFCWFLPHRWPARPHWPGGSTGWWRPGRWVRGTGMPPALPPSRWNSVAPPTQGATMFLKEHPTDLSAYRVDRCYKTFYICPSYRYPFNIQNNLIEIIRLLVLAISSERVFLFIERSLNNSFMIICMPHTFCTKSAKLKSPFSLC